jgi:hypothetical protein
MKLPSSKKGMSRRREKGQAALEFMMTYGWAIMLVMAAIGGLVYIMPHPESLTSNRCIFGPTISCLGVKLSADNLTVVLSNSVGQSIYNVSANVTMPQNVACTLGNTTLRAEQKVIVTCDNTVMNLVSDSKIRMVVTYKKIRDGYDQTVVGEIYAKFK